MNINTLRGLACVLLVLFHVAGDKPTAGLRLGPEHWLTEVNDALGYLRMPLFAFISGFVYALRPVDSQAVRFLRAKVRRLLLPLLTVGFFFAVLQSATGSTEDSPWRIPLIHPPGHFWFLQSLFVVFVVVAVLERVGALRDGSRFAFTFTAAAGLFILGELPTVLGLDGAVYLLPFFLGGVACRRFHLETAWRSHAAVGLLLSAALLVVGSPEDAQRNAVAAVGAGLCASYLLLTLGMSWRVLGWVGVNSYAIYLFHVFFTASSRMALQEMGVESLALLVPLGVVAGVVGPVVMARVIGLSSTLRLLLLGERPSRRPVPTRARA